MSASPAEYRPRPHRFAGDPHRDRYSNSDTWFHHYPPHRCRRPRPTFEYRFDVANGTYQVTLRFAEIYPNNSAANRRVFNVSIENAQVLQNFDIFVAAGGANIATDRIFNATVADGQ